MSSGVLNRRDYTCTLSKLREQHAHIVHTHTHKQRHMCSEATDPEGELQEGQACATWLNRVLSYVLLRRILLC